MAEHATDSYGGERLRFERVLDAPIDTVWRWLIEPELRARWFMGGPTDARVGGSIGLTMDHGNLSDDQVPTPDRYRPLIGRSWSERITAIDPPRLLAFEWDGGAAGVVTFELSPEGERTRLVLTHGGLRGRADAVDFGGGWHAHLAVLERRLRGDPVADFWALHGDAEARAAAALDGEPGGQGLSGSD